MKVLTTLFIHLSVLFVFSYANAQVPVDINSGDPAFPFPQFVPYTASGGHSLGNLATQNAPGVTHAEMEQRIRDAWQIMANRFEYTGETHAGVQYIQCNLGCPYDCSEGAGYGLIAAAIMGDKTTFDGIWFREHDIRRALQNDYNNCGTIIRNGYSYGQNSLPEPGGNSAADGDMDIALGLLLAWKQWGDNSGYLDDCGNPISYRQEALDVIRGLVELQNQGFGDCRSVTGIIGIDGYFKGGDTWTELTGWGASQNPCPEFNGPAQQHIDYVSAGYFKCFADFLTNEGGSADDVSWNIPQLNRAQASTEWLNGELYSSSTSAIPNAGWVSLDPANNATFTNFNQGEDFRHAWRAGMNYMWHGNQTLNWDPNTHQVVAGTNTSERDLLTRHAQLLSDPGQAPWNNPCSAVGGGPALTYMGPSQIKWQYDPNTGAESGTFPLNWNVGTGSPAAVIAQDYDLMGKLYRQCAIEWDVTAAGDGYMTSEPVYFHGFFRLLGMLILSGNHPSPCEMNVEANMKVYKAVDKTYAFTGDTITYTLSYRNYASITANNVVITDALPAGLEFISASNGGTESGGTVTWNIGSVPGFTTAGGIAPTQGSVTLMCKVAPGFSGRICNEAVITTSNGSGWTSNEYPNNKTAVMERNCVDIIEKALEIDKTANYDTVNPGTDVTYAIDFENASSGGFLNGGRPGVNIAYAHDGTAANASQHAIKIRLYHGAAEPYIDYGNYRISMFINDNTYDCIFGQAGCIGNGWQLDNDIYEGGNPASVTISTESIVPGSDAYGSWNQRVIVQFAPQIATTTPHLSRYFGMTQRIHQGGTEPLRIKWRLHANTYAGIQWDDDWSWNPTANDADGGLYHPVTNDWTDINNPNIPVTDWHNEACQTPTNFVDNILVEEWDGYTWRRVKGNGPLPGRDVDNVVVTDVLPAGFTFVGFVDASGNDLGMTATILGQTATYNAGTRTITWSIPKLQVGQGGTIRYKATADFSSGVCPRANEDRDNVAFIEGTNESPVYDTARVVVTCDPVILPPPPSSMTKTADKSSYSVGENITYTLEYTNTDGSIIDADLNSATNWTSQSGAAMTVSGGQLTNVANNDGVMTYDYSHGTDGTIEATISFQANAAFGLAFRHTGGAKANGLYVVFKPNPGGGVTDVRVYDGVTQVATNSLGYPGDPMDIKIELAADQMNLWLGNTTNPTPDWTVNGLTIKAGYAGVINGFADTGGDSYGTHNLLDFHTELDSGFELEISDPIPTEISFVSASNSGVNNSGTVEYPVLTGPVLAGTVITRTWVGTVDACPNGNIVNNAYTNIMGHPTNSIAAQEIVSCSGSPAPVELTNFEAKLINRSTKLTWVTSSELNNDFFAIQRTGDLHNGNWETIGHVNGSGNSTTTQSYAYVDGAPLQGINYYRLVQYDYDGTHEYSEIRSVRTTDAYEFEVTSIYPLPVNGEGFYLLESDYTGKVTTTIIDVVGKPYSSTVQQVTTGVNELQMDVHNLASGTYLLKVFSKRGEVSVKRFTVE